MTTPMLVSLFDFTGTWAKPYADAGWKVLLWDKQIEGCVMENFSHLCWLIEENLEEDRLTGLLAACPCTAFAGSGARWWPNKDAPSDEWFPFESFTEYMQALVWITLEVKDRFNPHFWAIENPVGRIEKKCPELKPYRKMSFQPWEYGDPYTKKTILWGEFNDNIPRNPVSPTEGSKMHKLPPSEDRATLRSKTPEGFAKAFYEANHQYVIKQTTLFA